MSLADVDDPEIRTRLRAFQASSEQPMTRGTVVWFLLDVFPRLSLRDASIITETAFAPTVRADRRPA